MWQMPYCHTLWLNVLPNNSVDCTTHRMLRSSVFRTESPKRARSCTSLGEVPSGDFRMILQRELLLRCERNPQYSLRSFAKSLQIDPSTLSQILRGKRSITASLLQKL